MSLQYTPQVKFFGSELKAERGCLKKISYIIKLHSFIVLILSTNLPLSLHIQLGALKRGGGGLKRF